MEEVVVESQPEGYIKRLLWLIIIRPTKLLRIRHKRIKPEMIPRITGLKVMIRDVDLILLRNQYKMLTQHKCINSCIFGRLKQVLNCSTRLQPKKCWCLMTLSRSSTQNPFNLPRQVVNIINMRPLRPNRIKNWIQLRETPRWNGTLSRSLRKCSSNHPLSPHRTLLPSIQTLFKKIISNHSRKLDRCNNQVSQI